MNAATLTTAEAIALVEAYKAKRGPKWFNGVIPSRTNDKQHWCLFSPQSQSKMASKFATFEEAERVADKENARLANW